ncbi:hypothetical protein ES703_22305 [subsurface metagenome]
MERLPRHILVVLLRGVVDGVGAFYIKGATGSVSYILFSQEGLVAEPQILGFYRDGKGVDQWLLFQDKLKPQPSVLTLDIIIIITIQLCC